MTHNEFDPKKNVEIETNKVNLVCKEHKTHRNIVFFIPIPSLFSVQVFKCSSVQVFKCSRVIMVKWNGGNSETLYSYVKLIDKDNCEYQMLVDFKPLFYTHAFTTRRCCYVHEKEEFSHLKATFASSKVK